MSSGSTKKGPARRRRSTSAAVLDADNPRPRTAPDPAPQEDTDDVRKEAEGMKEVTITPTR